MKGAEQSPRDLRLAIAGKNSEQPRSGSGGMHLRAVQMCRPPSFCHPGWNWDDWLRWAPETWCPCPRCVTNVPVSGTVTYLSCLERWVGWVSLRLFQMSGDLGADGSVGVPTTGPPSSEPSWMSGCGRRTCQWAYRETENIPYFRFCFSGLCICSDWSKWILLEESVLRPGSDGGGLVFQEWYLDRPGLFQCGTDRDGCESCFGSHGKRWSSSMLLTLHKFGGLG